MRRRVALAVAVVTALSSRAVAEPPVHLKTPSTVVTDGGSKIRLPAGYFLDEATWQQRDVDMKKAQEDATRFRAENVSLRKSAEEYPFNWKALGCALAIGVASGLVIAHMQ